MKIYKALTIAGSDSGAGAGLQADLKTFAALGVYGTSVVTAITAQNTTGVTRVLETPAPMVAAQIDAVMEDIGADAVKTGMLANARIIRTVADKVQEHGIQRLVVDPVMVAKGGHVLLRPDAIQTLCTRLFPLAPWSRRTFRKLRCSPAWKGPACAPSRKWPSASSILAPQVS